MFSQKNHETIKKTVKEFFQKMTFEVEIFSPSPKEQTVPVQIKTEDPQLLIGEKGQTLLEIQHLLKIMLKKKIEEPFFIELDVNDYKKKKTEYLKELARSAADEVAFTRKEKILASMPAYERRIIHMELAERPDIISESVGQEPERRVVVRPRLEN